MRLIGKKYPDFGGRWGEWFADGWFDLIENAMGGWIHYRVTCKEHFDNIKTLLSVKCS